MFLITMNTKHKIQFWKEVRNMHREEGRYSDEKDNDDDDDIDDCSDDDVVSHEYESRLDPSLVSTF